MGYRPLPSPPARFRAIGLQRLGRDVLDVDEAQGIRLIEILVGVDEHAPSVVCNLGRQPYTQRPAVQELPGIIAIDHFHTEIRDSTPVEIPRNKPLRAARQPVRCALWRFPASPEQHVNALRDLPCPATGQEPFDEGRVIHSPAFPDLPRSFPATPGDAQALRPVGHYSGGMDSRKHHFPDDLFGQLRQLLATDIGQHVEAGVDFVVQFQAQVLAFERHTEAPKNDPAVKPGRNAPASARAVANKKPGREGHTSAGNAPGEERGRVRSCSLFGERSLPQHFPDLVLPQLRNAVLPPLGDRSFRDLQRPAHLSGGGELGRD